ncbi:hypothetical protein ACWCQL_14800 [Streptomyces sp. NPDC002073]
MTDHEPAPIHVHQPVALPPPLTLPVHNVAALQPYAGAALPEIQTVQLPDGRLITGYALAPAKDPEPYRERHGISPLAVNTALGGIGFLAVCGGLLMLATFITALAALVQQLIVLAAVIFGGWIAVQVLGTRPGRGPAGTTVNIRRAVFKRNKFHT